MVINLPSIILLLFRRNRLPCFFSLCLLFSSGVTVAQSMAQGLAQSQLQNNSKASSYLEQREPCQHQVANKQVLFGDTHVHTKFSLDASTQGTRTSPADAYKFARGAEIGVQPWAADGSPMRRLKLARPLDFAVVTDHAELFGELDICHTPNLEGYGSWQCKVLRNYPRAAFFLFNTQTSRGKRLGLCGDDGELCRQNTLRPWQETQQAAEQAYDRSENCQFTSFVGYEWTGASPNLSNLHRNIIFKNEQVPSLPLSFVDAPSAQQLWDGLDKECVNATSGCEVLVIPHNSNLSDGYMFSLSRDDGTPITAEDASQRARLERLVEIMQHKGSSECFYNPLKSADELCGFEQLPYSSFRGKFVPFLRKQTSAQSGFVRDVLADGLKQQQRLGVNPFKLGFIASSDTHISAAGAVNEQEFLGHGGAGAPTGSGLPQGLSDDLEFNPGGLAAVWAEENSRGAIFTAMQRRETYATSGPRITLRFFAASELPEDICSQNDYVEQGYARGVPMGGDIDPATLSAAPVFTVFAQMDAGTANQPGKPLQRIQMIKSSVDANGNTSEKVFDIAGEKANGAGVDLATCETYGSGASQLCSRWQDPEFDPSQQAYYYARVLENPSCRWSQHQCVAAGVDCKNPDSIRPGFEGCCRSEHKPIIQERAWSSPIWYSPDSSNEALQK